MGPVASQIQTIVIPSEEELRDRFAMSALASLTAGHYHAGHYIGDPAMNLTRDTALAYRMADAMMTAR